ncbi:hypothetical protein ACFL6U_18675 [Planctomycetota bacterium]
MLDQKLIGLLISSLLILACGSCTTMPQTDLSRATLQTQVDETIDLFIRRDPNIKKLFKNAYGYAVLPQIVKGAFLVGGGHGQGHLFKQGEMVGYCSVSQASIGASIGGQTFREIIFFEDAESFKLFCANEIAFSAQVTAVAVNAGSALKVKYRDGIIVFIKMDKGLMADVSAGGQVFKYVPKSNLDESSNNA